MKKVKLFGALFIALLFLSSCSNNSKNSIQSSSSTEDEDGINWEELQSDYDNDSQQSKEKEERINKRIAEEEEEKNPQTYQTGITYEQLARTPDEFIDQKVSFSGKIIQVIDDDSYSQYRMAVDDNYDNIILVEIPSDQLAQRVLENDSITIYGKSEGLITYESSLGGNITIPSITVKMFSFN